LTFSQPDCIHHYDFATRRNVFTPAAVPENQQQRQRPCRDGLSKKKGWFVKEEDTEEDEDTTPTKSTGQHWLQKVLNHLWTHRHMAWKLRYADLHGIDATDHEAKRKAKLKPAIVDLYKTVAKLDYLDKRLFDLPLLARLLGLKSHEQTAWINVVARQAKTEAADHIQRTQRENHEFIIRPAAPTVVAALDSPLHLHQHLHYFKHLYLLTSGGRMVTLIAMPPAGVDFSWELVREERDNIK
jgi:hypothetical protein